MYKPQILCENLPRYVFAIKLLQIFPKLHLACPLCTLCMNYGGKTFIYLLFKNSLAAEDKKKKKEFLFVLIIVNRIRYEYSKKKTGLKL